MPGDCRGGANREERNGTHAVELGFSQVVELDECKGIAHGTHREIAPWST